MRARSSARAGRMAVSSRCRVELNRLNAGGGSGRARGGRRHARRGRAGTRAVHGHGPPLRDPCDPLDFAIVDDYAHHPSEIAATLAAARERFPGATIRVLFQPHLYSRTRHLGGRACGGAGRRRRRGPSPMSTRTRGADCRRHGEARRRRPLRSAACSPAGRRRSRRVRPACAAARSRETSCSCSAPVTSNGPSACSPDRFGRVEENVALARFTTIGTGGPARWFARPESVEELGEALTWAVAEGVPVHVIGLGSNVLVARRRRGGARAQARRRARVCGRGRQ